MARKPGLAAQRLSLEYGLQRTRGRHETERGQAKVGAAPNLSCSDLPACRSDEASLRRNRMPRDHATEEKNAVPDGDGFKRKAEGQTKS